MIKLDTPRQFLEYLIEHNGECEEAERKGGVRCHCLPNGKSINKIDCPLYNSNGHICGAAKLDSEDHPNQTVTALRARFYKSVLAQILLEQHKKLDHLETLT
jgi:hypothetical protein